MKAVLGLFVEFRDFIFLNFYKGYYRQVRRVIWVTQTTNS